MTQNHPVRVLQVIGALNRGGTETWLVNVLKRIDRGHVAIDFLVQQPGDPALEAEVRSFGAEILVCPRDIFWVPRLLRMLKTHGPYDVLHSHRNAFGAVVLLVGKAAGVDTLVAHSHTTNPLPWTPKTAVRRALLEIARITINRIADVRIGASEGAAEYLFGEYGESIEDLKVIYCGVDTTPLSIGERRRTRSLPAGVRGRKTLGHVGAFKPVKNHLFLLEVLKEMVERDPDWQLLLIGDGPMLEVILKTVRDLDVVNNVVFLGVREDVLNILSNDVDILLMPSKYEGLGLAAVEAQFAGVPSVLSTAVPSEAIIAPEIVRSLPLTATATEWADAVLDLYYAYQSGSIAKDFDKEKAARFDMGVSVKAMEEIYTSAHAFESRQMPTRITPERFSRR